MYEVTATSYIIVSHLIVKNINKHFNTKRTLSSLKFFIIILSIHPPIYFYFIYKLYILDVNMLSLNITAKQELTQRS